MTTWLAAAMRALCVTIAVAAGAGARAAPAAFTTLDFAALGTTRVLGGGQAGLVIVLADTASAAQAEDIARGAAARGRAAAVVNVDTWLDGIAAGASCFDATTLLDVYAQQVQQSLRFPRFGAATLVGTGRGAAFLPLLLAQARAGLFGAGISAGTLPALALPAPPCGEEAGRLGWRAPGQPFTVATDRPLRTPWRVGEDTAPAALLDALDALLADAAQPEAIADLPLVELPQPGGGTAPWLALVISGDGGWANIDKDIAEELGTRGIGVIGWNALRYFWEAKSPETVSADLARVVRHYTQAWNKPRVLLIGYSLGAEVLPFMASRATAEERAAIAGMVLLNPGQTMDFQFHISNWLPGDGTAPYAIAPEMRKFQGIPVLCLYAAEEAEEALCPLLAGRPDTQVQQMPGDHHFDGDYAGLTRRILARFPATP